MRRAQGSTSEMLKDIVTIFYEPLAKVYKAANIGDSIADLQSFLNDLIKTVEQAEEGSSSPFPSLSRPNTLPPQQTSSTPSVQYRPLSTSYHATKLDSTTLFTKCTRKVKDSLTTS